MIDLKRRTAVRMAVVAVVAGALLASVGCVRVPIERENGSHSQADDTVEIGTADRADVRISMGAGELFINPGVTQGERLMEAEFTFQPASWEPDVSYDVRADRGVLEVRQPRSSGLSSWGGGVTNRWDIALSEDLPIRLEANLGAGTSELVLGGLDLTELKVVTGAGDVLVDLVGEWENDLRATVEGGAGSFRVRVPADVGVRVSGARDGLGTFELDGFTRTGDDYVNDAYGNSPVTIELRVSRGVGEVVIEEVE